MAKIHRFHWADVGKIIQAHDRLQLVFFFTATAPTEIGTIPIDLVHRGWS